MIGREGPDEVPTLDVARPVRSFAGAGRHRRPDKWLSRRTPGRRRTIGISGAAVL